MKTRWIVTLLVLACLGAGAPPAIAENDFTSDANCVALYRCESGALGTDSIGTNDLGGSYGPDAETTDVKEGSGCADFERANYDSLGRADSQWSDDFPLKSTYAGTVKFSMCWWMKPESLPASSAWWGIWSKHEASSNKRSFFLAIRNGEETGNQPSLEACKGYDEGTNSEVRCHPTVLQAGRWYHVGLTYDDSTLAVRIRLWDDTAETVTDYTDTFAYPISLRDDSFEISGISLLFAQEYFYDGLIDEFVIFNDVLTPGEIDAVRGGEYGASAVNMWWWRRRHSD